MPRRIHILPDHLVNQIAAGEVVERPSSVVKELVENALDAGARRVDVLVRNGGKTEIRVGDDGSGMTREDAMLSLDRHATSKISDPGDLAGVRTLGFRGEALPSIASVSRMVIETAEQVGEGSRLVVNGGRLTAVESCARQRGTTVQVRSLFFNTPARAKFLKTSAAETRAISEVMTTLALAHPEVAFSLDSNGRELLALPVAADLRSRIVGIWGDELAGDLLPIAHREGEIAVSGLVEKPHSASPGSRRVYLFVNGRSFGDRYLARAADRGYRTTVAPNVRPSLFLFLDVGEGLVDVNVHPTKAEVRFRQRDAVEATIEEAVREGMRRLHSAPALARRGAAAAEEHAAASGGDAERSAAARSPAESPGAGTHAAAGGRVAPENQISLFVAGDAASDSDGSDARVVPELELTQPVMWQVHNTYIFAETRDGLIIVDQHSAHERVMYEEMMEDFGGDAAESQRLLFPLTLRLSPAEFSTVEELLPLFGRMGFEVEAFGGRSVIVHSVPVPHPYFDAERCLREMIGELTHGSPLVDASRNQLQRIALSFACKAAIKAGQKLSQREITELFDRLFATSLPYHDIHGRPTVVRLSTAELHNRFRRHG